MIPDYVHHDRTFWGIGFPIGSSPADETAIYIIKDDLEGSRNAVLQTGLEGLDLAVIADAVVDKLDGKSIEHTMRLISESIPHPIKLSCQKPVMPRKDLSNLRKGHARDLAVQIDRIEIRHSGDKIDDALGVVIQRTRLPRDRELLWDKL